MTDIKSVIDSCHTLADMWCDRREKHCLSFILPNLLSPLAHTDQLESLLDALKDVKGLCRSRLKDDEIKILNKAHNDLDDLLHGPLESR